MKNSSNTAKKLLDLPYAPEAEQYLDELERSGQFRIGIEAEIDDAEISDATASNDYAWGRGSGSVSIQDWWTTGRVALRVGPGLAPADITLARINDSLRAAHAGWSRSSGARGISRADPGCLHAAHHLQRRQRVDRRGFAVARLSSWVDEARLEPRVGTWPLTLSTDRSRRKRAACRFRCRSERSRIPCDDEPATSERAPRGP